RMAPEASSRSGNAVPLATVAGAAVAQRIVTSLRRLSVIGTVCGVFAVAGALTVTIPVKAPIVDPTCAGSMVTVVCENPKSVVPLAGSTVAHGTSVVTVHGNVSSHVEKIVTVCVTGA